ncbi:hypothetical protein JCM11251_004681 [Rhodosporidiobolus azoricus]
MAISQELAIVAVAVAGSCLLILLLCTLLFFRFYRRPHSRPTSINRNSVSYPTTTQLPQLGIFNISHPAGLLPFPPFNPSHSHPPTHASSHPSPPILPTPATFERAPPPSSPFFSISTTVSRTGSRVLTRNPSSHNSHGTSGTGSRSRSSGSRSSKREERRRSRPEKTKRVKKQFGVGEGEDRSDVDFEQETGEEWAQDDTVIVDVVDGRSSLRRRNSTWGANDLEHIVATSKMSRPPPASPPTDGTMSTPSSVQRRGARPLPPGAGYEMNRPVHEGADRPAEDERTEILELAMAWSDGRREIVVQDLRDLRGRPRDSFPSRPPIDARRWSDGSSIYANSQDEYTISAHSISQNQFFSTSVVPLPPPSPSSDYHSAAAHTHEGQLFSTWFASSHDSPERRQSHSVTQEMLYLTPSTRITNTFPPSLSSVPLRDTGAHSLNDPRASVLTSNTSAALEDLEIYAESLSSSSHIQPVPRESLLSPSHQVVAAASLSRRQSRRQDSAPWFASSSAAAAVPSAPDADPPNTCDTSVSVPRDGKQELVLQKARRPISWLARQKSDGSLPEGIATIGEFSVANPDSHSLKTSGGSSGRFSPV